MFFRRGVRDDRWLSVKIALFSAGALFAVTGMVLRSDWLIGAAALVLAAGIAVRFLPRDHQDGGEEAEPGGAGS